MTSWHGTALGVCHRSVSAAAMNQQISCCNDLMDTEPDTERQLKQLLIVCLKLNHPFKIIENSSRHKYKKLLYKEYSINLSVLLDVDSGQHHHVHSNTPSTSTHWDTGDREIITSLQKQIKCKKKINKLTHKNGDYRSLAQLNQKDTIV